MTICAWMCFVLLGASDLRAEAAEARPGAAGRGNLLPMATTVSLEDVPIPVPQPSALALQYHNSGNWLWVAGELWALAIPALWLFSGASARLRTAAQRVGRFWFLTVGIYAVLYIVLNFLIDLPFDYYCGFVRPHSYGLSEQTFGKWMGDALKRLAIAMFVGFLVLWVPFLLLKRSPRWWWLCLGLLTVPFMFSVMLVAPIWYDPLFNHYGPMKNKDLEQKILAQAELAGIAGSRIFEVDKSRDTKTVNAYVKGLLGTKRIVLWDTLMARLDDKEILFILGHEMGHYVLGHIVRSILLLSLLNLLSLYLIHRVAGRLIARHGRRFRFDHLADVASMPLLALLLQVISLGVTPLACVYSRYQEHEADRFALEITRANHSGAMAFVKLQEENLSVPRPGWLYKVWRATHPPIGERIDFCNQYHPWRNAEPLQYGFSLRDDSHTTKTAQPNAVDEATVSAPNGRSTHRPLNPQALHE